MPDQNQTTQNIPLPDPEPDNHAANAQDEKARRSRRRSRQFLGLVLAILIVVGAVSIVQRSVTMVSSMVNDTSEYQEYTAKVDPLVWFDMLPFDDIENVDQDELLQAAIWGLINEVGASNVSRNELGETLLASVDLDRYAAALYGPSFQFKHHSFEDPVEGLTYTYDEDTQLYTVPSTSITPNYVGTVVDIRRESGGIRRVIVGYVSTRGSNDELVATPDYEHPTRYMDYYFRRDGGDYYLYAVENNTDYVAPENPEEEEEEAPAAASSSDSTVPDPATFAESEPAAESEAPSSSGEE